MYAKWPLTYGIYFKKYRNTLTATLRAAKENYYKSKLKENAGNSKKTWEILNSVLGKSRHELPSYITFSNETLSSNTEIAEAFNNYFCNIAEKLSQSIAPSNTSFKAYLPEPVPYSLFIRPTTIQEVESVINNLKLTSPGYDNIDVKIVKKCSNVISPFLTNIINKSFKEGVFPKQLQIARVIPIFKKGDKFLSHNYRPVSVLPCFSKIFEKIMASRLLEYLGEKSLLSEHQFGFRPKYSTELAIHQLCQHMYDAIDNKKYLITVFCDLTKAFDTISHSILLEKLNVYGIRGVASSWFRSYLGNRQQYIVYKKSSSSCKRISVGVPQGSILGPILFLIYINDITRSSNILNFLLFADDTTIFLKGNDVNELKLILDRELSLLTEWLRANKLTLNIEKTSFMISHPLLTQTPKLVINIDELILKQVNEFKFLGITLDNTLKWKAHIDDVKSKLAKVTGVTYRIRDHVNSDSLKQIYLSLAYPHLLYCCALWGGAYKTYVDRLFVEQKKLIRIMTRHQRFDHTQPLFSSLRLLKLPDIIHLQSCLFVHGALHSYPTNCNIDVIDRSDNRINKLRIPLCRTSHAQQNIAFQGPKTWNQLPQDLKNITSRSEFKYKLKSITLSKYV